MQYRTEMGSTDLWPEKLLAYSERFEGKSASTKASLVIAPYQRSVLQISSIKKKSSTYGYSNHAGSFALDPAV